MFLFLVITLDSWLDVFLFFSWMCSSSFLRCAPLLFLDALLQSVWSRGLYSPGKKLLEAGAGIFKWGCLAFLGKLGESPPSGSNDHNSDIPPLQGPKAFWNLQKKKKKLNTATKWVSSLLKLWKILFNGSKCVMEDDNILSCVAFYHWAQVCSVELAVFCRTECAFNARLKSLKRLLVDKWHK